MSLKIFSTHDLPREEWDRLTKDSFLSSYEFARLWEIFGGCPIFLAQETHGALTSGLTGVIFGRSFYRRFKSMPDGLTGGIVNDGKMDAEEIKSANHEFTNYLKGRGFARIDIYSPRWPIEEAGFNKRDVMTQVVDLTGEYKPSDAEVPRHIRHGLKGDGVVAERIDGEDLESFYKLVLETASRHGQKPRYPLVFFKRLRAMAENDKRIIWPAVYHDGRLAAAHIYFLERGELFHWQGFSSQEHWNLKPNHLLLNFIIEFARRSGIGSLDLGGSPPEAAGLREFKAGWGGKDVCRNYYTHLNGFGKLYFRGKRR
ncbi:hypothetical protein TRIP_C20877 [Candidatus Zixiibacteriota bacterium]|nr:hypothetical protein TRIP_C20877 [candidate division Zixibacteria bacterium]